MKMDTILVAAATRREVAAMIDAVGGERQSMPACREFYDGRLGAWRVIVAVTGLGKVNTAMGITSLLGDCTPRLIINTGCGGAYQGSGLAVGDLAVATSEIFGDEGVETHDGWCSLESIGIPMCQREGVRYFNEFPLAMTAVDCVVQRAAEMNTVITPGKFVTLSTCSGTNARGGELARRFGAVCENMEGAAAAQVAFCHGVDCLEVRGISNLVEDRDLSRWDIDRAVDTAQDFLIKLLSRYSSI